MGLVLHGRVPLCARQNRDDRQQGDISHALHREQAPDQRSEAQETQQTQQAQGAQRLKCLQQKRWRQKHHDQLHRMSARPRPFVGHDGEHHDDVGGEREPYPVVEDYGQVLPWLAYVGLLKDDRGDHEC